MPANATSGTISTSTGSVELGVKTAKNNIATIFLSGTYGGFTVAFEGSLDGTTWYKVPTVRLATGTLEVGSVALVDNATVGFCVSNGVFDRIRVKASARSSGTLAVAMVADNSKLDPVNNMHKLHVNNVGKKGVAVAAGSGNANVVAVSSGPGILHKIVVTTAGASAGVIIYDNATTNSGTILYSSPAAHPLGVYDINMAFVNGVTVRQASTTAAFTAFYSLI